MNLWTLDGKLVVDSDGNPQLCSVCPCQGDCSESASLDLIFSGVTTLDSGCQFSNLKFTSWDLTMVTVTGTSPNWSASNVGSWAADVYNNGCDQPSTGTASGTFDVLVSCETGVYSVLVTIAGRPIEFFNGAGVSPIENQSGQGYFENGQVTIDDTP